MPDENRELVTKRLAAVRRAARKAADPDMKKLWRRHAQYFFEQRGNVLDYPMPHAQK